MKKQVLALALLALLGLGGSAFAALNTVDAVPSATLLLPYFEVDLDEATGINTLFSINNASATAVLAHVVFWTDQSVPTLDFDVYLTGYDVYTLNIRDILVNGNIPQTASVGQDPNDTISPQGPVSQDINFASCSALPYSNPAINSAGLAHLQAYHTGEQSPAFGNCAGFEWNDNTLRGYVTVDTVNACNLDNPANASYHTLLMTDQNVLWGDYFYVTDNQDFAQGDTLVHIEAGSPPYIPGDFTFYGRYNAFSAADNREPLPTTMAARYLNGGLFNGGTDLIVWREATAAAVAYNCNLAGPSWYPLGHTQIIMWDEEETPLEEEGCVSGVPCGADVAIPNEANRIDVADDLLSPFDFGWAYLNLQHSLAADPLGNVAQMWLTTVMDAEGRFSVGFQGVQLDNAQTPNTTIIPVVAP